MTNEQLLLRRLITHNDNCIYAAASIKGNRFYFITDSNNVIYDYGKITSYDQYIISHSFSHMVEVKPTMFTAMMRMAMITKAIRLMDIMMQVMTEMVMIRKVLTPMVMTERVIRQMVIMMLVMTKLVMTVMVGIKKDIIEMVINPVIITF